MLCTLSSLPIRSRANCVRSGLGERITMLLERGSASTTVFWPCSAPPLPWLSSSSETVLAMSTAMPFWIGTTSVSLALGMSMLAMIPATRSRFSA
ncbi:hypothetical protein PAERUG_E16_London_17_VIM_2_04_14_05489 [Pseudomonas aeruginosa]|nr:hypothetical protein PAERUG_E16_London_17_VIM_2_04_14_05489 [Pseudomonas aeruginosa]